MRFTTANSVPSERSTLAAPEESETKETVDPRKAVELFTTGACSSAWHQDSWHRRCWATSSLTLMYEGRTTTLILNLVTRLDDDPSLLVDAP